jgi:hypothetical protein
MIVCDSRRPCTPTKRAGSGLCAPDLEVVEEERLERGVDRHDAVAAALGLAHLQ